MFQALSMIRRPQAVIAVTLLVAVAAPPAAGQAVTWGNALEQEPQWYGSDQARDMAENILITQHANGGWEKNFDYARKLTTAEKHTLLDRKTIGDTTIDNSATTKEMVFLARVHRETTDPRFAEAFIRGLDYLLKAQYDNGGWPQFYPLREGYYTHITYNDDAMIRVMNLLRSVALGEDDYAFVDTERRTRARDAVDKGVECILKTQIVVDGQPTGWCAQHDAKTLAPTQARVYELESISGMETVPIVRFLMGVDNPSPQVVNAVQSAVRWLDEVKLTGLEYKQITDDAGQRDRVIVENPDAKAIWARFYEIGTNRPIFCGRDGVKKYTMAEIERERRAGYRWYSGRALLLLREDYPAWQQKWAPDDNVLEREQASSDNAEG